MKRWPIILRQELLLQPVPARALDGHVLGTVSHWTSPVQLLISSTTNPGLDSTFPTLNGLLELFESLVPLITEDACSKLLCLFILHATSGLPID